MSTPLVQYPRGQINVGQGTLQFAASAKFSYVNGAKVKHSLRRPGAGVVLGNPEVTGSIELDITENGPERDFFFMVRKGEVKQFVFDIPADSKAINAVVSGIDVDMPVDDAVKQTVNFVGTMVDS